MFFFEIWKVSYIHLCDLQCLAHVGLPEMLGYFRRVPFLNDVFFSNFPPGRDDIRMGYDIKFGTGSGSQVLLNRCQPGVGVNRNRFQKTYR